MRDLTNYDTIKSMNKSINGEINYSVYMHGVAYGTWFNEDGHPTDTIDTIGPVQTNVAVFNFSSTTTDEFDLTESADQIVLHWPTEVGRQFCYKGLVAIGDEIIYIDTYQLTTRPTTSLDKKVVIPAIQDSKQVIRRGVGGTKPCRHKPGRFLRSVVNLTNSTKSLSYSDNAELSESKPFSPVVSSGTLQLDISPIEWGYEVVSGEKNIYKMYEATTRQPIYLYSGSKYEQVCDFVAFSSSFNIIPHTDTIEIRISDKTSLYWNEEITMSYHFSDVSLVDIVSKLFEYRRDMITFPRIAIDDLDLENALFRVSNLNTKNYKYYKDLFSELCKEMLFRISFDSHENIILQSEATLGNSMVNPGVVDQIKNSHEIFELNEIDNIFSIERSTNSNILFNKIDNKMIEYKTFYDGNFFKLPVIHYVNNITEAKSKAVEIVNARKSHEMYIYDISTKRLYMAIYGFMYNEPPMDLEIPNQGATIKWIKNYSNTVDYTFTQDEVKEFKTPIKYAFSKIGELAVIGTDTAGDDVFSTYSIELSKTEAELLNPYSASGEYAVVTDGINDFHARVISIDKNENYTDIDNEFIAIIAFGYTKDREYNFTGKIHTLVNYEHEFGGNTYMISYKAPKKFTIFFARKELPYVWQYKHRNTVDYVNVPIYGSDTFEVYGNFGGIDTDDGKFAKMVADIENVYDRIFELDYNAEYTQMCPVYLRNIMMGPGKYETLPDTSEFENHWVSDYSNKYLMMQILRSKPTDILPKDTFLTTMKDRNSGNADFFLRITTLLGGGRIKLNSPYDKFPKGTILNIVQDLRTSNAYTQNKELLFDYYICQDVAFGEVKIPKLLADTISPSASLQNLDIIDSMAKATLVSQAVYNKVVAGDILMLSEPTPENYGVADYNHPTLTLLYQKYKNARWIVKSREKTIHGEYLLYLDYEYPGDKISGSLNFTLKFDVIKGYVDGEPYKSGYALLQEISIKGNPILEYTQNYYYENSKSIDKYGEKKYQGITGKFMTSINDVNIGVSYILNSFSGLTESSTKSLIPIQSSHIIGLGVLDYVRVRDNVYNTIDNLAVIVGKDYSIDNGSLKFTYKVFNINEYEPIIGADLIEISEYKPIKYPKYGYKEDGGWESTGQSITKNDNRIGEVKYKKVDPSLLSAKTVESYNESTSIHLSINGDLALADNFILNAGDNIIIEHLGKQHLLQAKSPIVNGSVELVFAIKNLFTETENEMNEAVSIPKGTTVELFQVVTVLSEIDSIIDKVEDLEDDMDDVVGNDGILSPDYPPLPHNIRIEPAINGFYVRLENPDKSMIKGYNVYYKRTIESDLNYKKEWIGLNSTFLIGGLSANREGTIKYNVYLKSVSHKGIESMESSMIFVVTPRVLEFDDIYYPPGQSPAEQEEARKELAELLGGQLAKLEEISNALDGKYGSIIEDLDENYFTKVETETEISIGMGNVKTDVTNQTIEMINSSWTQTQDLIASSVSGLEVQLTELGGRVTKTETEINQTKESIKLTAEFLDAKIDGNYQILTEKTSSLEITAAQIQLRVESLTTELDGLDGKVTREFTEINQTAKQIELIAQRTTSEFNKAELMTSNFIFNSGDFVNEEKPVKLPDGTMKKETRPMYWNYAGREDVVGIIDENGDRVLHTTSAEGFTYTGVTKLVEEKFRNSENHGIRVPGNNVYVLSATVKVLNPSTPEGYTATSSDPVTAWISTKDDFATPGVVGTDYEVFTLQYYNEKKDEILKAYLDNKYQDYLPPDEAGGESKYKMPYVTSNAWSTVAIVIVLKGSDANRYNIIPSVKIGSGVADIKIKNIQLRMGDQLKEWEPALAQMLDAENMVSYINITPDEIKLDSKLIKIGGGIVVEGENVAVKYLSAARLQLGDNFMFDEGIRDENNVLIPDTERLMIKKVQIGQIDSLKPDGSGGVLSLEDYIFYLDQQVANDAQEALDAVEEALADDIADAVERAEIAKKLIVEVSLDGKVSGIEKVELSREYKSLEIRAKSLFGQVTELNKGIDGMLTNNSLSEADKTTLRGLKVDASILGKKIYVDTEDSLIKYLNGVVKINEVHTLASLGAIYPDVNKVLDLVGTLTTTVVDPSIFSRYWTEGYDSLEAVLKSIQKTIDGMSNMGIANAATAFNRAKKAESDAAKADAAAIKAQEQADASMATIRTMSSDNILTAEEKSILIVNWIELEESCIQINSGIAASTMTSAKKAELTKIINDMVLSLEPTSDSLKLYLTNLGFFDLTTKIETTVVDPEGKTITKVIYGSALPGANPGKYFDDKWDSAYKARQEVLNEIQEYTREELAEATQQAILSMYGMYDPRFKHLNVEADNSVTLHLYTKTYEGKEPQKISADKTLTTTAGENNSVVPVFPPSYKVYYKNAMPVEDISKIHYNLEVRAKGVSGGSGQLSYGVYLLDGNYKTIRKMSVGTITAGLTTVTSSAIFTGDSKTTYTPVIKLTGADLNTKYMRPYIEVGASASVAVHEFLIENAQDIINSETIKDVFVDGKVTPDEKLELSRIKSEVQKEYTQLVALIEGPSAVDMYKKSISTDATWTGSGGYKAGYNNMVAMLNKFTADMNSITTIVTNRVSEINDVSATYYEKKERLVSKMTEVARSTATSDSKVYTDAREKYIQDEINAGKIVLNGNTTILGGLKIKSSEAHGGNESPVWTQNADYLELGGGKIKFYRGIGKNPSQIQDANYTKITEIGPHVWGEARTSAQADSLNGGQVRHFVDISLPFLKPSRTQLMLSQKSWELTKNVRAISLRAVRLTQGGDNMVGGLYSNTWRLYLEGTEEVFESYIQATYNSTSFTCPEPAYMMNTKTISAYTKAGTKFTYETHYKTNSSSGYGPPVPTIIRFTVTSREPTGGGAVSETFDVVYDWAVLDMVPTSLAFTRHLINSRTHTNRLDYKTCSISVALIQLGYDTWSEVVEEDRGDNTYFVKYDYKQTITNLSTATIFNFIGISGTYEYTKAINKSVVAAGEITYYAFESTYDTPISNIGK